MNRPERQSIIDLVEQAEALANSTQWNKTARKMRVLLQQWNALEPLQGQADREWTTRFRAAQQTFMERRAAYFLQGNLRKRDGLMDSLTDKQNAIVTLKNDLLRHHQTLRDFEDNLQEVTITRQQEAVQNFVQESIRALQEEIRQLETRLNTLEQSVVIETTRYYCTE
ncbi:MAG: DUF349 domain-containing protein [Nitrospirae bacterium]|nr:DUF349 domain-containing protein [Magnetococcales bacterium]